MEYRIKELRLNHDFSQKQIAEYLCITQQTYSRYEIGELEPSIKVLIRLARFYNISVDYLLGLSDCKKRFWNDKTLYCEDAEEDSLRKHKIINSPKSKRGRKAIL